MKKRIVALVGSMKFKLMLCIIMLICLSGCSSQAQNEVKSDDVEVTEAPGEEDVDNAEDKEDAEDAENAEDEKDSEYAAKKEEVHPEPKESEKTSEECVEIAKQVLKDIMGVEAEPNVFNVSFVNNLYEVNHSYIIEEPYFSWWRVVFTFDEPGMYDYYVDVDAIRKSVREVVKCPVGWFEGTAENNEDRFYTFTDDVKEYTEEDCIKLTQKVAEELKLNYSEIAKENRQVLAVPCTSPDMRRPYTLFGEFISYGGCVSGDISERGNGDFSLILNKADMSPVCFYVMDQYYSFVDDINYYDDVK